MRHDWQGLSGNLRVTGYQDNRSLAGQWRARLHAFFYGTLPSCLPELVSYTVYRWECAIRSSVILGFVARAAWDRQMELSMRMLAGGEVLSFLLVSFVCWSGWPTRSARGLRAWID